MVGRGKLPISVREILKVKINLNLSSSDFDDKIKHNKQFLSQDISLEKYSKKINVQRWLRTPVGPVHQNKKDFELFCVNHNDYIYFIVQLVIFLSLNFINHNNNNTLFA